MCNKIDLLKSENISELTKSFQKELKIPEKDIFFISAATGEGTQKLLNALEEEISKNKLDLT